MPVVWSLLQYKLVSFDRVQPIVMKIAQGNYPMGVVNLLSKMPEDMPYIQDEKMAHQLSQSILQQLQALKSDFPILCEYNLILSVERRNGGFTVVLNFSPDDVRKLSKRDTNNE